MKVAQGLHSVQKRRFDEGKDYFWTVRPWATFMKKLFIHSARECSSINNIEEIYISTLLRSSPQTLRVCILEKWPTRLLCSKINFSGQSVQSWKNLRSEKPLEIQSHKDKPSPLLTLQVPPSTMIQDPHVYSYRHIDGCSEFFLCDLQWF